VKSGWHVTPFEECVEKVTYTSKVQRKDFLVDGEFPIISQEDAFINGHWDNKADLFKVTMPIVVFGDHTKVLKYVDFDFVLGADGVKILQPRDFLLPKFFYYQLQTAKLDSLGYARHYKLLKELEIAYPPLPEQHRIVAILDEAFDSIATAKANFEANLQNARALFESHLHGVNTETALLGNLVNITTGKLDANAAVEGGQYPFFTCAREIYAINDYAFDCEAILLAGNNAVGDFNVKHYKGKFNAYQRTYVITVHEQKRVLYRFLYFQMLKSLKKFKAQSVGVGTKFLKLGMIKDMEIELPSLAEQERIVSRMDSVREQTQRLESLYQRKLASLDALKKSLLHQAFSGTL
jgi:type I restriction enzyme S subunit